MWVMGSVHVLSNLSPKIGHNTSTECLEPMLATTLRASEHITVHFPFYSAINRSMAVYYKST